MIGVFDSGVGGLSVYRELVKLLPGESYVYYADNAHCPYGEKTQQYIIGRARKITETLMGMGCGIIVVACNTATAAAIATLREAYPIPFVGMEPAVKPAAGTTQSGVIGVLATAGTLKGTKYHSTRDRYADGITVVEHVGEGFVELVESGDTAGAHAESVVRESLSPLMEAGADRIVLGCTHYPFLRDTIAKMAEEMAPGRQVEVIDPAPAAARQCLKLMEEKGLIRHDGPGTALIASGEPSILKRMFLKL